MNEKLKLALEEAWSNYVAEARRIELARQEWEAQKAAAVAEAERIIQECAARK
jgi:hypothetical protein